MVQLSQTRIDISVEESGVVGLGRFLCLSLFIMGVSGLLTTGCGLKKTEATVNGGDDTDSGKNPSQQKTTFDIPPLFDISQLKVGQWIQWSRKQGSTQDCVRWEIKSFADGADLRIQARFAKTCPVPDDATKKIETILIDPITGKVNSDLIRNEGTDDVYKGPLHESLIHNFIYMKNEKVHFTKGEWKREKLTVAAFEVDGMIYYNLPAEHRLHAFGLRFKDKNNASYVFHSSDPALVPRPEKP
jgi:hypothetical protein